MVLQISIGMSGPRGMGDKQGGVLSRVDFSSWGVDLSANLSFSKLEVLTLVARAFSVNEKRPENASW